MQWLDEIFHTFFTYPIFNLLMWLYMAFSDMGLAIVVLTLLVFLGTFPLTWKRLQTVKATQALQPEVQKLKQQYAAEPLRFVQEQQALYKQHGISTGLSPSLIV